LVVAEISSSVMPRCSRSCFSRAPNEATRRFSFRL
jgi:hypothetical protein